MFPGAFPINMCKGICNPTQNKPDYNHNTNLYIESKTYTHSAQRVSIIQFVFRTEIVYIPIHNKNYILLSVIPVIIIVIIVPVISIIIFIVHIVPLSSPCKRMLISFLKTIVPSISTITLTVRSMVSSQVTTQSIRKNEVDYSAHVDMCPYL